MIRALITTTTIMLLAVVSAAVGAPPPEDMVKALSDTIRKKCPEAKIEVTTGAFVAKHGTMMFTLHSTAKSGEISSQTYQQEGPNFKGFILRVALEDGKYGGAAKVPQTLQDSYFPTFIDTPATDDGKKHYQVHFSYGSRLDPELKNAILEAIPKTQLPATSTNSGTKAAAAPALKAIDIDGGYGHLRQMILHASGELYWTGWEPPRKAASEYKRRMSAKEVSEIWQLASNICMDELREAYAGGDHTYTVKFTFADRTKSVKVTFSEKDDRPAAFAQLMERLWKTRDKK